MRLNPAALCGNLYGDDIPYTGGGTIKMIRGKAELTGGFLKEGWDRIYDNLVNRVDPHAHAASYAAVQDSEWYAEPEFSGKYLDLCVQIYKRTGNLKALKNARVVVDSILEHQRGDGYLGPYRAGLETAGFGVWNQTFTLLGMLSYYRATKEAAAYPLRPCEICTICSTRQWSRLASMV